MVLIIYTKNASNLIGTEKWIWMDKKCGWMDRLDEQRQPKLYPSDFVGIY